MTINNHGSLLPHSSDPATAPFNLCPCTQACLSSPDPVPAEWTPLDGITQDFAAFAREATTTPALQAAGAAFYALSDEICAHQCYSLAVRGLFPARQGSMHQGLEQTVLDLERAIVHWDRAAYWLGRAADEHSVTPALLESLRQLCEEVHQQTTRLLALKERVWSEWRAAVRSTAPSAPASPESALEEREVQP